MGSSKPSKSEDTEEWKVSDSKNTWGQVPTLPPTGPVALSQSFTLSDLQMGQPYDNPYSC